MNRGLTIRSVAGATGIILGFLAGRAAHPMPAGISADLGKRAAERRQQARQMRKAGSAYSSFDWSQVESDDPSNYAANLRAIGCPERTIGDIVRARVSTIYQARVNAILNPLARYWNTTAEMRSVDDQVKAIQQERDDLLATLNLKDSSFDTSSTVSPDNQACVTEALRLYPKAQPQPDWGQEQWQQYLQARQSRVNYLAQFLTPDELLDYRIAQDGNATGIARLLYGIKPTDDEFRKVFEALDGENLSTMNGVLSPGLDDKIKQALGDDRYAEFQEQQAPSNSMFNTFLYGQSFMGNPLTDDQVQQLKQLRSARDSMDMTAYREAVANVLQNRNVLHQYFISVPGQKVSPPW